MPRHQCKNTVFFASLGQCIALAGAKFCPSRGDNLLLKGNFGVGFSFRLALQCFRFSARLCSGSFVLLPFCFRQAFQRIFVLLRFIPSRRSSGFAIRCQKMFDRFIGDLQSPLSLC